MSQTTLLIGVVAVLIMLGIWMHYHYSNQNVAIRAADEISDTFGDWYKTVASWF